MKIIFKHILLISLLLFIPSQVLAICVAGSASSTSSSGGSGSGSGTSSSGSGSGSGSAPPDMWEEKVCYNNRPDCPASSSSGSGSTSGATSHFFYFQRSSRNGVWLDERTQSLWSSPNTPACTSDYDVESCDSAWFNDIPTSDNYFTEICGSTCTSVAENPTYNTSSGSITCMVYYVDDIADCQAIGDFTSCSTSAATFCGSPATEIQWDYNCECTDP